MFIPIGFSIESSHSYSFATHLAKTGTPSSDILFTSSFTNLVMEKKGSEWRQVFQMQNNNGAIKIRALRKPHVTRQIQNINSAASLSNALRAFSLLQMPTCDTEKIAAQLGDKICKFFIKYMEWTKKSESNLEYLNTDGAESCFPGADSTARKSWVLPS